MKLKGFLLVAFAALGLLAELAEAAEQLSVSRKVCVAKDPPSRTRAAGRTWFFSEIQPYQPFDNLMRYWIDRPLFADSSLRMPSSGGNHAGFYQNIEVAKLSGLDGFASIAYLPVYREQLAWLKSKPVAGYSQMVVLCGFKSKCDRASESYRMMKEQLILASKCPSFFRINGKVVAWSYYGSWEGQLEFAKALRADPEVPPFVFFCDIPFGKLYGPYARAEATGKSIPSEAVADFKAALKQCLDVADGIVLSQMMVKKWVRDWNGEYGYHAEPLDLYRNYLLPITKEMISRPEYKDKMLGGYIMQTYANHLNGPVHGQYGTEMLRAYLDELTLANPDVVIGFEWNEANENTHFQPMVSAGTTIARILRYYRAVLNHEPLQPFPGDDTRIPNVIVSTRRSLRLGEPYHVELIDLPDGTLVQGPAKVRVLVKSLDGKVLMECPWETLGAPKLTTYSYNAPTEGWGEERVVTIEVETEIAGRRHVWTGFDCTRLHATACNDYIYTRQPLRGILNPVRMSFEARETSPGEYAIQGEFAAQENLTTLEVLDGIAEAAAVDPDNEFDRTKYDLFEGVFSAGMYPTNTGVAAGTVRVHGSKDWRFRSAGLAWSSLSTGVRKGDVQEFSARPNYMPGAFLLAVPKADTETSVLELEMPGMCEKRTFDLRALKREGKFAATYAPHVRLELSRLNELPDYPRHLNRPDAKLTTTLRSNHASPIYQLRAVSKSGRVWRSAPILPKCPRKDRVPLEIFSETDRKPVKVTVRSEMSVDIDYDFGDLVKGDWLPAKGEDRRWDATLGGSWKYSEPMTRMSMGKCTPDFETSVPKRATYDGRRVLVFSGKGEWVAFPIEAIPNSSPFTLSFEFLPMDAGNRVLIRMSHSFVEELGLRLTIENGELVMAHFGRGMSQPTIWKTGLKPKLKDWNEVTIVRGNDFISCSLGGESKRYPYNRRALWFQSAMFGANVMRGEGLPAEIRPFKGLLRSFHIRHSYLPEPHAKLLSSAN